MTEPLMTPLSEIEKAELLNGLSLTDYGRLQLRRALAEIDTLRARLAAAEQARQQAERELDATVRRCNQHTRQADRDIAEARGQRDDALMRTEQAPLDLDDSEPKSEE